MLKQRKGNTWFCTLKDIYQSTGYQCFSLRTSIRITKHIIRSLDIISSTRYNHLQPTLVDWQKYKRRHLWYLIFIWSVLKKKMWIHLWCWFPNVRVNRFLLRFEEKNAWFNFYLFFFYSYQNQMILSSISFHSLNRRVKASSNGHPYHACPESQYEEDRSTKTIRNHDFRMMHYVKLRTEVNFHEYRLECGR